MEKTHYLASAFFALGEAVARGELNKAVAVDILKDQHDCGMHPEQRTSIVLELYHHCLLCATRYDFDSVEEAFDAVLDNIAEFCEE